MNSAKVNVYKTFYREFVKSLKVQKILLKKELKRFVVMEIYHCKR